MYDLIVVGSGVNGIVCAILAAQDGLRVKLLESYSRLGGGVRTEELTLPGFRHDICSSVHPFGKASPVLRELGLESEGLEWVEPTVPLAHPLEDEEAVILYRDVQRTVLGLGSGGDSYGRLMERSLNDWECLQDQLLGPALRPPSPSLLLPLLRFGIPSLLPASVLGARFGERGAALWAGLAAHSLLPMEALSSSAVALVLGLLAHRVGWPMPRGGAESIALALQKKLQALDVEVELNRRIQSLDELEKSRVVVLDLSGAQLEEVAAGALLPAVHSSLKRYRVGPGVFKLDYALSAPVPWLDPSVSQAGTVHLGGSLSDISVSESQVWAGSVSQKPFMLGVQASLFDPDRAPPGQHTFWVYIHTPNGWSGDATGLIEAEMERYAPGFKETVLAKHCYSCADYQSYNPNYVGGDILGGANTLWQVIARPRLSLDPYHLGGALFCCSASVPPGGGVHGMGGFHSYQSVKSWLAKGR